MCNGQIIYDFVYFCLDFDDVKSPSAIDYGDINELAEDYQVEIKSESMSDHLVKSEDNTDYDADDDEPGN